nr:14767_t:CDS:2 [Entrophospora candida]
MLDRIGETFVALEEAVSTGLIRSYGISSNSFSVPPEDKHFLPFEDLIERAKNASRFVRGTEKHGFAAIQLPGNLLEQYGLKTTAKWAKENGLKVFINRPLNAFNDEGGFRLASYPKTSYEEIKNSTIKILENQVREGGESSGSKTSVGGVGAPATFILEIVKQLDKQLPNLTNVFQLESVKASVNANLRQFHANQEINSIAYPFIDAFDAEVRYRGSLQVRKYLIEQQGFKELNDKNQNIEEFATNFLFNTGVVDVVLMGMTRERYVDFGRKMLKTLSEQKDKKN